MIKKWQTGSRKSFRVSIRSRQERKFLYFVEELENGEPGEIH
jgi:hypothetical protein